MSGQKVTLATVDLTEVQPVGELVIWTPERAKKEPNLAAAVQQFESLDTAAGRAAARFLREEALANDPSTKTYLHVHEGAVQGFFSCCAGSVCLTKADAAELGVPYRRQLPAFIVAWVARAKIGTFGLDLMMLAYAVAIDMSKSMGLVAFALDPMDWAVAEVWESEPYGFQRCIVPDGDDGGRPPRLWLPLG